MPPAETRTPEQVRQEIEAERERLTDAVGHLRSDLVEAANVAGKVAGGLALAAGIGAVLRYSLRRRRH